MFRTLPVLCTIIAVTLVCLLGSGVGLAAPLVHILAPPSLSVLPFFWMQQTGAPAGVELDISLSPDHQRSLNLLATGQGEFLVTGLNVGAKAYNKDIAIQLLNVNAWVLDYVVTREATPRGWRDLMGKKIVLPLQGGPLDFLVQAQIAQEKLPADRFQFVYAAAPQAIQFFNLGQVDAVVLPEPSVTQLLAANSAARIAIDIQTDWGKWHNGDSAIPYVGLFVNSAWAGKNSALTAAIADAYSKGVAWMNANPAEAAKLGGKVLGLPENIVAQALQRARLEIFSRAETKRLVDIHLREMLQFDPDLVGGKVPDGGFYR